MPKRTPGHRSSPAAGTLAVVNAPESQPAQRLDETFRAQVSYDPTAEPGRKLRLDGTKVIGAAAGIAQGSIVVCPPGHGSPHDAYVSPDTYDLLRYGLMHDAHLALTALGGATPEERRQATDEIGRRSRRKADHGPLGTPIP